MKMDIDTSSSSSYYSYSITNLSNNSSSSIKTDNVTLFCDCLYYDDTTDSLWVGAYDSSSNKQLYFARINGAPDSTNGTTLQSSNFIIDSTKDSDTSTFAIQGSVLYLAYKEQEIYYLQRATITENADGTFAVSKVGSAKSVSDLGVSGAITDIAILYDGTVYVLVSNVGNTEGDFGDSFNYYYDKSNTMYSRGALLKIQSTSSGFEVVDTLGWTGSSRQIAPDPVRDAIYGGESLKPLTAYIPSFSEKSNKFYGPRRFVAIKPKEIAIADCGANFVMPNCDKQQRGKMFAQNRVVTVSLSSFAITDATELRNIKFSNLTLDGSGTSGGYIYAEDCDDKDNGEIREQ